MSALTDLIDAPGRYRAYVDANDIDYALAHWDRIRIVAANAGSSTRGPNRRERASAISALRRACEKATGTKFRLVHRAYSETYGFMHASYFTYEIVRQK
jgi:hypothetical protein